jgi:tubulin monoglycylase TTLL3/8
MVNNPEIEKKKENSVSHFLYLRWKKSCGIEEDRKVFSCDWNYPDIVDSLKRRGWYENNEKDSQYWDFRYARKARIPEGIKDWQILNHFPRNYELSAKWNLAGNIIKPIPAGLLKHESYFPRCFQMEGKGLQKFIVYFKLTFAQSLLKLSIINPSSVSNLQIHTAYRILSRYLLKISKKQSDFQIFIIPENDWENLQQNEFECTECESRQEVEALLQQLSEKDPQFELSGFRNIWILKPGRKSRGRDIKLFVSLPDIINYIQESNFWVGQKYIENPLLINGRKFDIRQWVLITDMNPLTIWIYQKCYIRFAAEIFSFDDLENNFKHLTNNSIAKESAEFTDTDSMWHLEQFKDYLFSEYSKDVWTENIYPKMVEIIKSVLRTPGKLLRKNSFELLGLDLMITTNLTPWLLEINTSPTMEYSTVIII